MSKNYTIVKRTRKSFGKWPSFYGNGVFLDYNYILEDLLSMVEQNLMTFLERNHFDEEVSETTNLIFSGLK